MFIFDSSVISRRLIAALHDMVALALCWYGAYWLRFNLEFPEDYLRSAHQNLLLVAAVHAPVCWLLGLYRGIWRYASLMDLRRIIVAISLAAMVVAVTVFMFGIPNVPRSVLLLHPILVIGAMGGKPFYLSRLERPFSIRASCLERRACTCPWCRRCG